MIRTVLAHPRALICGALAHLLARETDIRVVAEVADAGDVEPAVRAELPDVAIVDAALLDLGGLAPADRIHRRLPDCAVLVLADARCAGRLGSAIGRSKAGVGFLAMDGPAEGLARAVRLVVRGEAMVDPALATAARRARNPLTPRESAVLEVAASGEAVPGIATRLRLSAGTVRNHLSRAVTKTGARNRIEAIRAAQRAGWI